jgi:hypothetical protein
MPPAVENSMWQSLRWLKQIGEATTSFAAAVALVSLVGWWFLGDKVEETTRGLAGTDELLSQIESNRQEAGARTESILDEVKRVQDEQTAQSFTLSELAERVDSLEPISPVTEYDVIRSRIKNPCVAGKPCAWTIRARRTVFGETCEGPPISVSRHFVDSAGNEFIVANASNNPASRISTDWTIVQGAFLLPAIAAVGIGEFYMRISYKNCGGNSVSLTEETLYLRVEVVKE